MRFTNKKTAWIFSGILVSLLTATGAAAEDVEGGKDHPIISRYPGSSIMAYDFKDYNEYAVPAGKMQKGKLSKSIRLEGKVTQITYSAPEGRSLLEIFRNYESAVQKAGFTVLFSGKKNEMGDKWLDEYLKATARVVVYGGPELGTRIGDDFIYLAAKTAGAGGDIYAVVCVGSSWFQNFPIVQLDIIESKPMDTGLVKVDAEALAKDIERTGHASVYGIYFDTGKADVKPESEEALGEIAKLLEKDGALKLYVVGHTDNAGTLDYNMDLSKRRAEAAVKVLISKYKINMSRLHAAGVGPLSPVSANKAEDGRAKNRRVELVRQ